MVSALAEFAITILIQQKKNFRTESKTTPECIDKQNENNSSVMSQQKETETYRGTAWGPSTPSLKEIVENHSSARLMNEVSKGFSINSQGYEIDLMAALLYPVVFLVFNCIYWSHFCQN